MLLIILQTVQVEEYGANFAEKVKKLSQPSFVMFYTPWCEYVQAFRPEWEKLSYGKLVFAQVNCVENRDVCQEENIQNYPMFRLYKDGQFYARYRGSHKTEDILQWLSDKLR